MNYKRKRRYLSLVLICVLVFTMALSTQNVMAETTDLPIEVSLYAILPSLEEEQHISIPDTYLKEYQITLDSEGEQAVYSVSSGYSVDVSETGMITPKKTMYYRYKKGSWLYTTTSTTFFENDPEYEFYDSYEQYSFGKSTVQVTIGDVVKKFEVSVIDYSEIYVEQVIREAAAQIFSDDMTNFEKAQAIGKYIAQTYDYDAAHSSGKTMILYGGGDCWASTSLAIDLAKAAGLNAWSRNGNKDFGAGSGHRNAMVDMEDGTYAEVDAGYSGKKPRAYSVTLRDSLFSIKTLANQECQIYQYDGNEALDTLIIPSTVRKGEKEYLVTEIASSFYLGGISSFKEVQLPETIKSIGDYAFYNYSQCAKINIPASVEQIAPTAFQKCKSLTNIVCAQENPFFSSVNGTLYNKDQSSLLIAPVAVSSSIPDTVTSIGDFAFSGNEMTTFEVPKTVKTIGKSAFYYCSNLTSVTIPDTVTSIGEELFKNAKSDVVICGKKGSYAESYAKENGIRFSEIESMTNPEQGSNSSTSVNNLVGTKQNKKSHKKGEVIQMKNLNAKYQILSVDSAKKKGTVTFVKPIDKKKTKIVIPKSLKIDGITFQVRAINKNAFQNCKKLKKISILSTTIKSVGKNALKGTSKKLKIQVPKKKKSIYKKFFSGKGNKKVKVYGSKK